MEDHLQKRLENWLSHAADADKCNTAWDSHVAIGTTIGLVRSENQDRSIVLRATFARYPERNFALAAVCDGMGGMARGGDAASLALSTFATSMVRNRDASAAARLEAATRAANDAVYKALLSKGGATISSVLVDQGGPVTAVNVGDSRIYEVDRAGKVAQVSTDDTLGGHLDRTANPRDADRAELHQLVQYVGMGDGLEPHVLHLSVLSALKYIVITSDGAHGSRQEMFNELLRHSSTAEDMVARLLAVSRWMGGRDNATVIALATNALNTVFAAKANGGATIEVWSPFGKVEFWGFPISPSPDDRAARPAARDVPAEGITYQARPNPKALRKAKSAPNDERGETAKRRMKSRKRSKKERGKESRRPAKPQLDIRFSSGKSSSDDSETS